MGSPFFDEPVVATPQNVSNRARGDPEKAAELAAEVDPRGAVEVNPRVPPLYEAAGSRELRKSCNYMVVQGGYTGETPQLLELENVAGVLLWKCAVQSVESIKLFTGQAGRSCVNSRRNPLRKKSFFKRYKEAVMVARAASAGAKAEEEGEGEAEEEEEDVVASGGRKRRKPQGGEREGRRGRRSVEVIGEEIITISLPRSPEDDGAHGSTGQEL